MAGRLALIDGQWRIATGRVANQLLGNDLSGPQHTALSAVRVRAATASLRHHISISFPQRASRPTAPRPPIPQLQQSCGIPQEL